MLRRRVTIDGVGSISGALVPDAPAVFGPEATFHIPWNDATLVRARAEAAANTATAAPATATAADAAGTGANTNTDSKADAALRKAVQELWGRLRAFDDDLPDSSGGADSAQTPAGAAVLDADSVPLDALIVWRDELRMSLRERDFPEID